MRTTEDRSRGHPEEDERFWEICLKVARSKPYLSAEAVESEAVLIILGLKPEPE